MIFPQETESKSRTVITTKSATLILTLAILMQILNLILLRFSEHIDSRI